MKLVSFLCVVLFAGISFGQGYIPYAPGSTAVVNQQAIVQQQQPMVPPPPGLPIHEWRDGLRETYTNIHEIRPVRPWEGYAEQPVCQQQPQYYQQQYYQQPQYYRPQCQQYYQQPCQQWYYPCQQQYYRPQQWYPGYYMGF